MFALLALLIGTCAVVFPASAQAAPTSTGSITVSGPVARSYAAYQIFSANVVDGDSDDEDPYPWRDKATVLWSRGDILPSGGPACAVRLALGRGITVASQDEERTFDVQVVSECFIPSFLQGLLEGRDPFSIIESYVS